MHSTALEILPHGHPPLINLEIKQGRLQIRYTNPSSTEAWDESTPEGASMETDSEPKSPHLRQRLTKTKIQMVK